MVDCHPEETLSTEAEPRLTMLFKGWRSTMSSRKECNIYFIIPNVPISYTTSILCIKLFYAPDDIFIACHPLLWCCQECRVGRHWFLSSNRTRIYSRMWHFLECHPSFYSPCKNRDIQKCHPYNWPIRLQETNMRYNNLEYFKMHTKLHAEFPGKDVMKTIHLNKRTCIGIYLVRRCKINFGRINWTWTQGPYKMFLFVELWPMFGVESYLCCWMFTLPKALI